MANTGKTAGIATALLALVLGMGTLMGSGTASAQAVGTPCTACTTGPTTPPPNFTPPPVVTTPQPTPRPDRPMTWNNTPSDMRTLTQFDAIGSLDRLLTAPAAISLAIPRQAQPNKLENRLPSAVTTIGSGANDDQSAREALESAKPLI